MVVRCGIHGFEWLLAVSLGQPLMSVRAEFSYEARADNCPSGGPCLCEGVSEVSAQSSCLSAGVWVDLLARAMALLRRVAASRATPLWELGAL